MAIRPVHTRVGKTKRASARPSTSEELALSTKPQPRDALDQRSSRVPSVDVDAKVPWNTAGALGEIFLQFTAGLFDRGPPKPDPKQRFFNPIGSPTRERESRCRTIWGPTVVPKQGHSKVCQQQHTCC
jgi:hypothetical protein